MSDGFLHHIRFCSYVINPFFDNFLVVVTNVFLEDMITVIDILYPVY